MYKIRRKDGLFSKGGTRPEWTKKGKVWTSIGHVTNHLRSVASTNQHNPPYDGTEEIIKYEMTVRHVITVQDHMEERNAIKAVQDAKEDERMAKRELKRLKEREAALEEELKRVKDWKMAASIKRK